ncbi:ABC transporter ATP-binding protein [Clostridiaceae bacterium HSG29]|nr:ABC transporter ATP-binding protein [Clostridiaceae bacterium HSG29]
MEMILLENVGFSYGKNEIFNNINLNIKKEEILCVIGPNGSGKSTLLDCILGLKNANNGDIYIDGKSIKKYKINELAKHIAYIPQKQTSSFPFKIIDMVVMGRAAYVNSFSGPNEEDLKIARNALNYVGLSGFENRFFTEISGGEAQLVMIARAITQDTKLILMDEPTSHLDFHNELMVLEVISKLVKSKKISVIMATHFPNHAYFFQNEGINTKVGILYEKRINYLGKPDEILIEENIKKAFKIKSKVLNHYEDNKKYNYIVPLLTEKRKL